MSENVKDIISLLESSDITTFDVSLPSRESAITFKQLTTEQLKQLLKTVVDSPVYNTEYTLTTNRIIKDNCLTSEINTESFNIYEKLIVIYKTRIESISEEYTFNFTEEEIKEHDLSEKSKTINIKDLFDNFLKKNIYFSSEQYTVNNCTVTCNLPIISTENKLEKELHKNTKMDVTTPEDLRSIVGETFINEITKYITSIKIDDTEINLLDLDFKTRIKIVEKLPTKTINKLIKYIENYRNSIKELTSVKIEVNTKEGVTTLEKDIPQDATFFNM